MSEPDDLLARLDRAKRQEHAVGEAIGGELLSLFQTHVEKRQTKLGKVADAWGRLVPEHLQARSCLEGLHRGRLNVIVDSAPHLYELKQLLLAGLEAQLVHACRAAGVRRVGLRRGRWYDDNGNPTF